MQSENARDNKKKKKKRKEKTKKKTQHKSLSHCDFSSGFDSIHTVLTGQE